ncbi:MAG TPA: N-6 DNA methylase [Methylococcaceae bacterium]|nr:N-6 DNA methylase [Methylococcaceae bacterium]
MTAAVLKQVLEATGYLENGLPVSEAVKLGDAARAARRRGRFIPDASWRGASSLTVYFKHAEVPPSAEQIEDWRRDIWNEGFAPLLWVVTPSRVDLYNGFGRPIKEVDAERHRLRTFEDIDKHLHELDALAGRLAMETGQFWQHPDARKVDRKTCVDELLLKDLERLESDLVGMQLERATAQALIGRSIFTQYLIDRGIVDEERLFRYSGQRTLSEILRNPAAAAALFQWLAEAFNGDMFPASALTAPLERPHLARVADFLEATDQNGQISLFPYRFDIIPVELISSIYQQFVHSQARARATEPGAGPSEAKSHSVHYTRLPVVSLILDEVMDGITGNETVLDLTCGSGVFLVEALRRLVSIKAGTGPVTRELIRSTLYRQIYGVDISDAAIRVAAFSLYLAALELDPEPQPPEQLKFEKLIGSTLLLGDARNIENTPAGAALTMADGDRRRFDLIVGNPPWNFKGKSGTDERRKLKAAGTVLSPRGECLDFAFRAMDFGQDQTRYGLVLSAMPFFSRSRTGIKAAQHLVRSLSPVTLVNLAALRGWLFPSAKNPAMVLLARCRPQRAGYLTMVNVHWSLSGEKSHTFEISPNDIVSVSLESWEKASDRLKTAAFGRGRDKLLLDDLRSKYECLDSWLASVNTQLRDGFTFGKPEQRTGNASELQGLQILRARDISPFKIPDTLGIFTENGAQRPRVRSTYRAPLVIIKEILLESARRPVVAMTGYDLIYTDSYFGISFPREEKSSCTFDDCNNAECAAASIATILSSALASWFILLTSGEFGLWKQRLFKVDIGFMPIPSHNKIIHTEAGKKLLYLENKFRITGIDNDGWQKLDQAVFDLYELDEADRIVVMDGLERAGWEWKNGREKSVAPATTADDLRPYAQTFATAIDGWLQATGRRSIRAEVFDLPQTAPIRIVRFVIENQPGHPRIEDVKPQEDLAGVLARIGQRLNVRLGSALVGSRELRVYGVNEIVIIKPAARRFWMRVMALEDADAVIAESFRGAAV